MLLLTFLSCSANPAMLYNCTQHVHSFSISSITVPLKRDVHFLKHAKDHKNMFCIEIGPKIAHREGLVHTDAVVIVADMIAQHLIPMAHAETLTVVAPLGIMIIITTGVGHQVEIMEVHHRTVVAALEDMDAGLLSECSVIFYLVKHGYTI